VTVSKRHEREDPADMARETFLAIATIGESSSSTITPKVRHLIHLGIDIAATHLDIAGSRQHVRAALDAGATPEEIVEVIELVSLLGIHAVTSGVPILAQELEREGLSLNRDLSPEQIKLKEDFIAGRGYWAEFWDDLFALDMELFVDYNEWCMIPWRNGHLSPQTKELIYIGIDCAATHLYEPGLRIHIRNARNLGVCVADILEVFRIASMLGLKSVQQGTQLVKEEVAVRNAAGTKDNPGTPAGHLERPHGDVQSTLGIG
jgi:alkylhydroperoxidase/carboxymuconolactone decarboxylase family protein YurZ